MNTKLLTQTKLSHRFKNLTVAVALVFACATLTLGSIAAYADAPVAMAPPVASAGQDNSGGAPSSDSVFNWTDIPQNQQVPINRASFDEGGYQLYDSVGETIIVPFQNNDLYVMKFAPSDNGSMYFVNDGTTPILYVPSGGYLSNATVAGARWYPFSPGFQPSSPVFIGPAPSWDAFIGMGWYPGMFCYGGYWCGTPYWDGGIFLPTVGLFFVIGGHYCYGWNSYHSYFGGHPGWSHPSFYRHNYYQWASHPALSRPPFGAVAHPGFSRGGSSGSHSFARGSNTSPGFHGIGTHGATGSHVFRGAGGSHSFSSSHSFGGGATHSYGGSGSHTFRGASSGHSYGYSGSHSYSGGSHSYSSSHAFRGASSGHYSYGGSHSYGGSSHSFSGGSHSSGGHSFSGGGHSSGHRDH